MVDVIQFPKPQDNLDMDEFFDSAKEAAKSANASDVVVVFTNNDGEEVGVAMSARRLTALGILAVATKVIGR